SGSQPYHHLFGLSWMDFCENTPFDVGGEVDLSRRKQLLDLALVRRGPGALPQPLPDGFEDLGPHNLMTFKSYQEALALWALYELIAHWVNYRKQVSPSPKDLVPESEFRLYAVCVRFPHNLAQQVTLTPVRPGVYEVTALTLRIRIIVIHQLPKA